MYGLTPRPAAAQEQTSPPPVELTATVDYVAVQNYMRTLPAETLIRIAWADTGQADRAVAIARRESGLRCDADNPRSSASGLFQTLSLHRPRAERLNLSWANITGPDCLDDVFLARAIYADSGWRPWRT